MSNMDYNQFLSDVLVILVVYKKTPKKSIAWQSLMNELKVCDSPFDICIYDNSPYNQRTLYGEPGIHYYHDPTNPGVSKAYNYGFGISQKLNKKWLLLLDQDTQLPVNFLHLYYQASIISSDMYIFAPFVHDYHGLLSPFRYRRGWGKRLRGVKTDSLALDSYRMINSGLLIATKAFGKAGGYEERLPLDFSDIAFCEKLGKHYTHFFIVNVNLQHDLSGSSLKSYDEELSRFVYFCKGALVMSKLSGNALAFNFRSLARAILLAFRHKKTAFIRAHYKIWH